MATWAKVTLFIGACLAIFGGVIGFTPISADAGEGIGIACGSPIGGGVEAPPPICAEPLAAEGESAVGLLAAGLVVGAAAGIFGRR